MKDEKCDDLTGLYTRRELYTLYQNMSLGSICHFMFMDIATKIKLVAKN